MFYFTDHRPDPDLDAIGIGASLDLANNQECHMCTCPDDYVFAAKQTYGVDLVWDRPKDKIVIGDDELLEYIDTYHTADGRQLPKALIKELIEAYGKGVVCTVDRNKISFAVDCRSAV